MSTGRHWPKHFELVMVSAVVEQDRTFLGMTHNPFIKPDQGFFERGDRKTHLEQLRHLSQWSRRVLLVTGPEGVGKTSLYRQLCASLEPRVKAARVNGSLINTSREVVLALAQGFGLAAPGDATAQLLTALVEDHVGEQERSGRQCVVLIDDAQLLEPRAIDELIAMADRSGLRMVLFGEVRVVAAIERSADRAGVGWHEIRLTGYGEADAREYLEWRFRQVKYRGRIPFTDQQVKEIVRLSEGIPGRINQMSNVLLVKLETGGLGRSRRQFPRLHASVLLLLVVLTALAWVVFVGSEGTDSGSHQTSNESSPSLSEVEEEADPDVLSVEEPIAEAVFEPIEKPDVQPDPKEIDPVVEKVSVKSDPAPAVAAATPVEPAAKETEKETRDVGEEVTPHDSRWLLAQPASSYTVQLITLSSAERAAAFVAEQRNSEQFAIYQLARDGRTLHVVVYGVFGNRVDAERAAQGLSGSAAKVQPWIRAISQVHTAIRTLPRQ